MNLSEVEDWLMPIFSSSRFLMNLSESRNYFFSSRTSRAFWA